MTLEEITALLTGWRQAWACHDSVALAANYSDTCIVESPTYGKLTGRTSVETTYHDFFATFPDAVPEFGDSSITGHMIVQTMAINGTDTGGFLGQTPTGSRFRLFGMTLFDLGDGLIVRERRVFDFSGLTATCDGP